MYTVIFLDFDGVCNNHMDRKIGKNRLFSKKNISPINGLFVACYLTDVKIIISSAWNIAGADRCKEALYDFIPSSLVDKVVIGATRYSDDLPSPVRNNEINEWLEKNPSVKNWLAIHDDFYFYERSRDNIITIDGMKGFLDEDLLVVAKKINQIKSQEGWK